MSSTVRYGLAVTLNMGNYQSLKVNLELEESDTDLETLKAKVREKLKEAIAEELKAFKG